MLIVALPSQAATTIEIVHFSDYHSHALPFFSEGTMKGGVARLIAFAARHKKRGALVLNGGDMMNKGAPAWSDKYHCVEWAWFNGVVDAMAFGNHDADYGNDELTRCRATVQYPILSANTTGFERYRIVERKGVRIGVFAIAGPDFPTLVTNAKLAFSDTVVAARDVVDTLRNREHVNAVVMIGHEHAQDDFNLAAAVPGIDVIFGTHTHLKQSLEMIPGTRTWFISPFQYGTYVSVVSLHFVKKQLTNVDGRLVPIDDRVKPDPKISARVAAMQRDLEKDPAYRDLFKPIASLAKPLDVRDVARLAVDTMRDVAHADVAISTASSFRQALPSGAIDLETLRAAMPYDNEVVVVNISGTKLQELLSRANTSDLSSDARAFVSGAPPQVDVSRTYAVALTDYMAKVSASYRDLFSDVKVTSTGARVRSEVLKRLQGQL